jgi:phosphate:Na+ symporter
LFFIIKKGAFINYYLTIMQAIGGLGIFLLGMIVLTDGLHSLAGNAMRNALMKFTRSPLTGAVTGATTTALLQSSSATTVAAVGFVGAGLMSFPESLGIIFGANIGTTVTGWLVLLLGFKLKLDTIILPVIFIGAILKLFSKKRLATIGFSCAGFGLIFVGISMMQQGMAGIESIVTPEQFPPDTWIGRIQLLLLGVTFTLITQSSSAGVAVALTALYAGAINFNQAAVLVIGMDVGTTVTAAMATIGASIGSKRTGFSHVIYNVLTAVGALLLLTPYTLSFNYLFPNEFVNNPEIALVIFHSLFNVIGVILILPFTKQFAQVMTTIVKSSTSLYSQQLDQALLSEPSIALTAALSTTKLQLIDLLCYIKGLIEETEQDDIDFEHLQIVLDETHSYVDLIHLDPNSKQEWKKLLMIIHVLDHMQRLHERCSEESHLARTVSHIPEIKSSLEQVQNATDLMISHIKEEQWEEAFKIARATRINLSKQMEPIRNNIMTNIALGELTVPQATSNMEAIRWLQRVFNHIARISYHLKSLNNHIS